MTDPLYQRDAYLAGFDAHVTATHPDGVVLDRSAFFPGGGGQPADEGTLAHVVGHESKGNKRLRIALDPAPAPALR